jgi:hypothetical protein
MAKKAGALDSKISIVFAVSPIPGVVFLRTLRELGRIKAVFTNTRKSERKRS